MIPIFDFFSYVGGGILNFPMRVINGVQTLIANTRPQYVEMTLEYNDYNRLRMGFGSMEVVAEEDGDHIKELGVVVIYLESKKALIRGRNADNVKKVHSRLEAAVQTPVIMATQSSIPIQVQSIDITI